jgi:Holliday junction resolvase RusA-like endonuclease
MSDNEVIDPETGIIHEAYNDAPFFTVTLSWPPSQNMSIKSGTNPKTGKHMIFHTKEVKDWEAQAAAACAKAHEGTISVFIGDLVQMHISLYPPSNHGDIDGVEKKIMDCLQGHAYTNDRQVYRKVTERTLDTHGEKAHVVVRVWEFGKPFPLRYNLSPNSIKGVP